MRAHILHHVPFELIGNIGPWLAQRRAEVTETHFWDAWTLPDPAAIDLLVIMGGPMSVNDEATRPWLIEEKAFIREAVARGTPTLGICLGSQLIANAYGARVQKNTHAEHGWFEVERVAAPPSCFQFPERFTPFHSHGETFDLPTGAVHLARSAGCENQAFQLGARCMAMQFHLESNAESAGAIVDECGEEYPRGPYVRSAEELRRHVGDYAASESVMHDVLDYLVR